MESRRHPNGARPNPSESRNSSRTASPPTSNLVVPPAPALRQSYRQDSRETLIHYPEESASTSMKITRKRTVNECIK